MKPGQLSRLEDTLTGYQLPTDLQATQVGKEITVRDGNFSGQQINGFHLYRLVHFLHLPHGWVKRPTWEDDSITTKAEAARLVAKIATIGIPLLAVLAGLQNTLIHPIPDETTPQTRMRLDHFPVFFQVA